MSGAKKENTWFSKLSPISLLHYYKLLFRSALLIWATVVYILRRANGAAFDIHNPGRYAVVIWVVWIAFTVEMALRFFPSKMESMGCQKQFKQNFKARQNGQTVSARPDMRPGGTLLVLGSWILLNGAIGALRRFGIIDDGILVLISLAYSVCDVICILFFCPFQTWMMKNRCCVTCRIYNWDYAMMFTPLLFTRGVYTWSLLALALGLLVRWEITHWRHPERFSTRENQCLDCSNCAEKLCRHKKQLQRFMKRRLVWFERFMPERNGE